MASVGMVWNAGEPGQVRYVCGLTGGLKVLGASLRNQAAQPFQAKSFRRTVRLGDQLVGSFRATGQGAVAQCDRKAEPGAGHP